MRMIEVLQKYTEGLTVGEWRAKLSIPADEQSQLDRRRRELRTWFVINRVRDGSTVRYIYGGPRTEPAPSGQLSQRIRAQLIHSARGRCSMCGRTIERHGISLIVDHKIPRAWGGSDSVENLWVVCEDCNAGKKDYFASQDQNLMRSIMRHSSVHVRIGETLKAFAGKPTPSYLLDFVSGQDE